MSHVVLFVDDEGEIRRLAQEFLESRGLVVYCAANGTEGIAAFNEHRNEVTLVVTDVKMPKMDGIEMIRELLKIKPSVKVIVASCTIPLRDVFPPETKFLVKPYALDELLQLIGPVAIHG
jgi:two-component system cell cycle sensor histidine kinase/response regulator CckA